MASWIGQSNRASILWVEGVGPRGKFLAFSNAFTVLQITNRSDNPIWIESVALQYKSSWWKWKTAQTLDDGNVFIQSTNRAAWERVVFHAPNINQIAQSPIDPHKSYRSYALFEYPDNTEVKQLRFKVCDTQDECSVYSLESANDNESATTVELISPGGFYDLSDHYLSDWRGRPLHP